MHILVIEDHEGVQDMVKMGLEEQGFRVSVAKNGITGWEMLQENQYDLAILDVILPGMSGLEICKEVRSQGNLLPIIMVSALDEVEDRIAGLEVGADDYLIKPFNFKELMARVKALDRRKNADYNVLVRRVEDLEVNFDNMTAKRNGKRIDLTKKEFRLLEFFMMNEGKVLSKMEIAEKVWGVDFNTGTNFVEVYVNYLRNKLDKGFGRKLIHTKFGIGYIFNPKQNAN
ncbi:MAG: response regulator transcription factor [Saprospiraceae bacterium]|nr:MAG: PhoB family transcriptional regulator [Bacteroidetes bacterium OLB9]MCO6463727.1 response regulator transcription factor [Saprospiraceae bacterium]